MHQVIKELSNKCCISRLLDEGNCNWNVIYAPFCNLYLYGFDTQRLTCFGFWWSAHGTEPFKHLETTASVYRNVRNTVPDQR